MSLESSAVSILGGGAIDAAGGSAIVLGVIFLVGIGILLKQVQIGLSSAAVIIVFILGYLAQNADSRYIYNAPVIGTIPLFQLFYILLVIGAAIYWAIFIRRR